MKAVIIGTVFVDIKGFPEGDFVLRGRNVGKIRYVHGGVARNIAEDVVNFGYDATLVTLLDHTGTSDDVLRHLKEQGVNTDYIHMSEDGLGTWLAIFDETGEIFASVSKRQNLFPLEKLIRESQEELFGDADAVFLEVDVDETLAETVVKLAKQYGVDVYGVSSNIKVAKERIPLFKDIRCFVCNRDEAGYLFDEKTDGLSRDEFENLAEAGMKKLGLRSMIVTMDKDGCVYASVETDGVTTEKGSCPAIPVDVIDTTGAGDSFFAAASCCIAQNMTMKEACETAAKVAAAVIGTEVNVYTGKKISEFA